MRKVYTYTWQATGRRSPCTCGGELAEYTVHPFRRFYLTTVWVCMNPDCKGAVSSDGERKGRVIIA